MSYLEKKSKEYADRNMANFNEVLKKFEKESRDELELCGDVVYKANMSVAELSYLFENGKKEYKYIETRIINSMTKEDVFEIYLVYIANIHERMFGGVKLNLDKVAGYKCVTIDHHAVKDWQSKPASEYEMLCSVYMCRKVKEIQSLMEMFIRKYVAVREHVNIIAVREKERIRKEIERLENEEYKIDKGLSDFENVHTLKLIN